MSEAPKPAETAKPSAEIQSPKPGVKDKLQVKFSQRLASGISRLLHRESVNPQDVLSRVSEGAVLPDRRKSNMYKAATERAGTFTRKRRLDQETQDYIQSNPAVQAEIAEKTAKLGPKAKTKERVRIAAIVAETSRRQEGLEIKGKIDAISKDKEFKGKVDTAITQSILSGEKVTKGDIRDIKTHEVTNAILAEQRAEADETKAESDRVSEVQEARGEMLASEDYQKFRKNIFERDGLDPSTISDTRLAQVDTEAADMYRDKKDADLHAENETAQQHPSYTETFLELTGNGMPANEARERALEAAKDTIRTEKIAAERAAAEAEGPQSEADKAKAAAKLGRSLDSNLRQQILDLQEFQTFAQTKMGGDTDSRQLNTVLDTALGEFYQQTRGSELYGEVRAQMLIKEGRVDQVKAFDDKVMAETMARMKTQEQEAAKPEKAKKGKSAETAKGTGAEAKAAAEDADTAEGHARKLRPKRLLRELGVDVDSDEMKPVLEALRLPANAEVKKEFVDTLARIQRVKAAADKEGLYYDAVGAIRKIMDGHEAQKGEAKDFGNKRFFTELVKFLGAVAVELAKATVTTVPKVA